MEAEPTFFAGITAIGTYVPERIWTNHDFEKMVDTSHEWIIRRTGIEQRRFAAEHEFTSHLCFAAVRNMMDRYSVGLQDVDYIIVSTTTPDTVFPSVSALVQAEFCIPSCGAIDVSASCAGFVSALQLAHSMILSGLYRKILVIGAETLSKVTNFTDRTTCILFGDGAGAVLVERIHSVEPAFVAVHTATDGTGGKHVYRTGVAKQLNGEPLHGDGTIVQNGREVYRWAVSTVPQGVAALLQKTSYTLDDIDWFVPHSANLRMIESICEKMNFPMSKTLTSLIRYGNTSAATIPLAIDEAVRQHTLQQGDLLLLYGFGAGLVQSGLLLRWTMDTDSL